MWWVGRTCCAGNEIESAPFGKDLNPSGADLKQHERRGEGTGVYLSRPRPVASRWMQDHTRRPNPAKERQLRNLVAPSEEKVIAAQSRLVGHCRPAHQRIGAGGSSRPASGNRHGRHEGRPLHCQCLRISLFEA